MTEDQRPIPVVDGQTDMGVPAIADPVDRTSIDPHLAKQYMRAETRAKAKQGHVAPPGSLELPDSSWQSPKVGDCAWTADRSHYYGDPAAQLRTAYVRVSAGAKKDRGWTEKPGVPKWLAIGIVCGKCGAVWLRPGVDLATP
jgi:hypothetical protein